MVTYGLGEIPYIPEAVVKTYAANGVKTLFPWQLECLTQRHVLDGENLIFNAPTSGGKTLVSELILISRFLQTAKKALFILPYISIVTEKLRCFERMMKPAHIRVRAFCGNQGDADLERTDVAICTIEKANRIVTMAMDDKKIGEIGIVIVDELHMIGEGQRGAILELVLTKLKYVGTVQLVGMSATLPNITEIACWLNAKSFQSDFRPVPLQQYLVLQDKVYFPDGHLHRELPRGRSYLLSLIEEVKSCIVFCPTKFLCEKTAYELSQSLPDLQESAVLVGKLMGLSSDGNLISCVRHGVAYHHSGLTSEEKEIVEVGFGQGKLKMIAATSTLAAGVNLPAQRVVITHMKLGKMPLQIGQYRQMCGRAGRTGCDTIGDSYLFSLTNEKERAFHLLVDPIPPVISVLEQSGLKRVVLEVVSAEVCEMREQVKKCVSCTFHASASPTTTSVDSVLNLLLLNRMLEESGSILRPTLLGRALLSSSLPPEEGLAIYLELENASSQLCLLSDLHLIYLSSPVFSCISPDWKLMLSILFREQSKPHFSGIYEAIGISEDFVCRCEQFPPGEMSPELLEQLQLSDRGSDGYMLYIHSRFYTALILSSLNCGEEDTAGKFRIDRGSLQTLQHQASSYLTVVGTFSAKLGLWQYEALFLALRSRAAYVDQSDLQQLLSIPEMDISYARVLATAGLYTLGKLAKTHEQLLVRLFEKFSIPDASAAARKVSVNARKRFAKVFLGSKRRKGN